MSCITFFLCYLTYLLLDGYAGNKFEVIFRRFCYFGPIYVKWGKNDDTDKCQTITINLFEKFVVLLVGINSIFWIKLLIQTIN